MAANVVRISSSLVSLLKVKCGACVFSYIRVYKDPLLLQLKINKKMLFLVWNFKKRNPLFYQSTQFRYAHKNRFFSFGTNKRQDLADKLIAQTKIRTEHAIQPQIR
jgi:hypothetical protein